MDKIVDILLAEDNLSDVVLLREALQNTDWKYRLHVTRDGVEALDFLGRRDDHSDAPLPGLIVLDLNLPKKTGFEVLTEIRGIPFLSSIPVIILSGSEWERSAAAASGFPEESYIVKPMTYSGSIEVAKRIENLWRMSTGNKGT